MKKVFGEKFLLSFWGYRLFGQQDTKETVRMWRDAGFNTAISFIYRQGSGTKEEMLELLDCAQENGLSVILYDDRIHCHRLVEMSEEEYEKAVLRSVSEFASHPAAAAFFVSDEPNKDTLPLAEKAVRIVRKHSPVPAFVNFYPMWRSKDYVDLMGVPGGDVGKLYSDFVKASGAQCIAYDCYAAMDAREPETGMHTYFDNLNTYRAAAQSAGVPFVTSLLCTGHWSFCLPTLTDMRWQLSTAIAHGAKGVQWFMLYDNEDKLGDSPVDVENQKQPSYYDLRKVNREFAREAGDLPCKLELEEVYHFYRAYGGTQLYARGYDEYLENFSAKYPDDAVIGRFRHRETGNIWFMFVNGSREAGNQFRYEFCPAYAHRNGSVWIDAGKFYFIELKEGEEGDGKCDRN